MKSAVSSKAIFYIISITLLAVVLVSILPLQTHAIDLEDVEAAAKKGGLAVQFKSFEDILLVILQAILALAMIVAVTFVVISGYTMMISRGDEEKLTRAKRSLLWAIVGILVIALSWFIVVRLINLATQSAPAAAPVPGLPPTGCDPSDPSCIP